MRPPPKFNPHPFSYHQELEVTIESLTNEGNGVARVDGWVVFVPFSLPGEKVRVRVYRNHKNYSDADLIEVIEPSAHRIPTVCPLFGKCGGCQYQHLAYEEQLVWKRQQVAELLKRMAHIEHPVEKVIPSPRQYGYRSKITPHFHRPKNGSVAEIGFLRVGTRNAMIDVPECPIAMPQLNESLRDQRKAILNGDHNFKNGATLLLRASEDRVLTQSHEVAREKVGAITFEFQAGDFFQNNPFILPAFVDHVVTEARQTGARHLVDAYCGSGLFGLSAAAHFESVIGIEISETSVAKARHNAALNDITNATFTAASAERLFEGLVLPPGETVVVIDPPRAGCGEDFLRQLAVYGPSGLVYVSCNPPTQMRDLVILSEAGYKLGKVQPFDLFPQTRHLECVMTLTRSAASH
ncbi:MAG: class I SAM-dependent RNA methyltransferase [Verrucomicrobiaceae bacterium]|nr:class I SAM-dependent RNA methyltransferase [Verrucomicrobiaceae bacterium]